MEYDDDFPGGRGRVADLRAAAQKAAAKLEAELGRPLEPAFPHGRQVARSFWGRAWCRHIESFQDYESRLPRGRSYLRNGAVLNHSHGAETDDWRTDPAHPFHLTTANLGGLLVFRCARCHTTIRQKHFRDHRALEHTVYEG